MVSIDDSDLLSLISGPKVDHVPIIAGLRERDPVCWIPGLDAWFVTRHEDVRSLCNDPRITADIGAYENYQAPTDAEAVRWLADLPFRATPTDPESLGRRLVYRALTPRAIERTRHRIAEVVEEFAAPLRQRDGVADLVKEFTRVVSVTVMGRLLGIPSGGETETRFRQLPKAARNIRPFISAKDREKAERAGVEMCEFVVGLMESRDETLQEGIITDLLATADASERTTKDDIVRVVAALIATGRYTSGNGASRALFSLLNHPEQLELLRRNRELLPNAIEELLRYDSGIPGMVRYAVEDFELRGQAVRKGQLVLLSIDGANRDPRVFPDPDRLDFTRDTRASLAFGHGQHYCIGINIARSQMHLMIDAALDFIPLEARVLDDEVRWGAKGLLGQLKSLPVDLRG